VVEGLEDRRVPATFNWDGGGLDGNWNNALNWDRDQLPGSIDGTADVAMIGATFSSSTVTHASGTTSIGGLTSAANFALTGGTFSAATIQVNNAFTLGSATLANARVLPGSGGQGVTVGGFANARLQGVQMDANLDLAQSGATVQVANGLTLNGTATLRGYFFLGTAIPSMTGSRLIVEATAAGQTLGGTGTVACTSQSFGSGTISAIRPAQLFIEGDTTLTIGQTLTISGVDPRGALVGGHVSTAGTDTIINRGTIRGVTIQPDVFTNQGTVGGPGGTSVSGTVVNPFQPWSSTGIIRADGAVGGGFVTLAGTFSLPTGHTFQILNGGAITQTGILQNTGNTVTIDTSNGVYSLSATTATPPAIVGGTITGPAGSALTIGSARLDGVTVDLNLNLTGSNAQVQVANGLTLNGTATLQGSTFHGTQPTSHLGSRLIFEANAAGQTLGGTGAVVFTSQHFTGGGAFVRDRRPAQLFVEGDTTLTIEPGMTLSGAESIANLVGGSFSVAGTDTIINRGTILSGLTIQSDVFTNQGTISVASSVGLSVTSGTFTQAAGTTTINSGAALSVTAPFTVTGGVLMGVGSVNANVINGAQVNPGLSPGILTINGNYTQTAAGVLNLEINGTTAGTAYDLLRVNGTVTLVGTLNVTTGFAPVLGNVFVLIDNDGTDAVAGLFTGRPEGSFVIIIGGRAFQISYQGSTGNDVALTYANTAPALGAISNQTVNEASTLTFTATASDQESDTLTFSLDPGAPAGATINPTTGAFTWTPAETQDGTHSITVRVTDNRSPNLSDTKTFMVTVNELNQPPVLAAIGSRTVNEGSLLTFTASATDPDLPANSLTFSLLNAPTGASINASTGAFSWTPTEAQGPGSFPVTIRVTDNGSPNRFAEETLTITVNEVNAAPVLASIGNRSGTVGNTLSFTATATDGDLPTNTLTFSLDPGAPAGASINSTTGVFTWTPATAGSFPVTIRVTDNGTPSRSASETITITVAAAANPPPVLSPIGNKTVNEGTPLTFTATATDPDAGQTLTFSLLNAPTGASINASTGVFSWTPTESQGPGSFSMTVRVTDNGSPNLFDEEQITVTVNEVNVAPVLAAIGNRTATAGSPLTFTATATDADSPVNTLTFSLDAGAPANASINPSTGQFTWTPPAAGIFAVTVRVTDNGTPNLSDTEAITITVSPSSDTPLVIVHSVVINDGHIQRSMVNSLAITFSSVVTLDPGAFEVRKQGGGLVNLIVASSVVDGRTVAVVTFTGTGISGGSLADGNYQLTILGSRVHDGLGQELDGDSNGTAGGNRVDAFFRFFGDSDGDRDVDVHDLVRFLSTLGKRRGDSHFLWYFDYDSDGNVGLEDAYQFALRFGRRLNP
jgi:hypothetical protein